MKFMLEKWFKYLHEYSNKSENMYCTKVLVCKVGVISYRE